MGDVIMFRPRRDVRQLDAELEAEMERILDANERESRRRTLVYAQDDGSHELNRILGLYPMFRLIHRAARTAFREGRLIYLSVWHLHGCRRQMKRYLGCRSLSPSERPRPRNKFQLVHAALG
jgi:hypothetical protein